MEELLELSRELVRQPGIDDLALAPFVPQDFGMTLAMAGCGGAGRGVSDSKGGWIVSSEYEVCYVNAIRETHVYRLRKNFIGGRGTYAGSTRRGDYVLAKTLASDLFDSNGLVYSASDELNTTQVMLWP